MWKYVIWSFCFAKPYKIKFSFLCRWFNHIIKIQNRIIQNCLVFLLCFVDDENQSHARKLRLCSFRNVPGKTVEPRFLIDGQIINVQEYNDDEEMIVAVNARSLKKLQWGLNPWSRDTGAMFYHATELWSHWRWEQVNCGFICSRERDVC